MHTTINNGFATNNLRQDAGLSCLNGECYEADTPIDRDLPNSRVTWHVFHTSYATVSQAELDGISEIDASDDYVVSLMGCYLYGTEADDDGTKSTRYCDEP